MTNLTKTSSVNPPTLKGYTILELLYLGSRTAVYRGVEDESQTPVVIKVLRREYPSFGELVQLRNQYAIAQNLPIAGIVQPLRLESLGNGYALVMEDVGGIALGDYCQQKRLGVSEVLDIAIQVAEILHHLHQHRIIHKDIKPANLLIHPESKEIKLIDFSIASLLPKETQEIQSPNILEGTLAYIAPEQTGRMNRGIDYRTDFYGLGVTLYELLTGRLPFTATDPLELIHYHIAQRPTPIEELNPAVPLMVGAIAAKLMAKNAEDRYQSALGLKYDLEACLTQWQTCGEIQEFSLGTRDLSDRFLIPEKLYGRQAEVQTLLEAFDRVAQGTVELMLVAGFSGIGKTAVINEVHKPIVRQRGYFIKGKFDQFNRQIPLSAFIQALQDLMGQLLSESDSQLEQWKTKILSALGDNGQVLIEVLPELEQVIGSQPEVTELSGTAAQNRFNLLFQQFISVFTTSEHPLVLFLDDLQWADPASLQLIKLLMNEQGYLLLLGAYRDNEVFPSHPFIVTVEELKKAQKIIHTLTLAPLKFENVNNLVADTLHCSQDLAKPLTELINQKTRGNPFFTTQFIKALHEDHYISFNYDQRYWQCDLEQVHTLSLTNNVVEFMALQLQKLPETSQEILKLAACVGNQFDLNTLAIVSQKTPHEVALALWQVLREGFVIPTSRIYKFFQGEQDKQIDSGESVNPTYRFLHDRVQQAAYSLIPRDHKQVTHLKIGELLQENLTEIERDEKLFDIVGHLNLGQDLIEDSDGREKLARFNLEAAQKARTSTAYSAALEFVQMGLNLLDEQSWETQYDLTLNLHIVGAEIAYLNGNLIQMETRIEAVLHSTPTILDRVKVYEIKINALTAQTRMLDAVDVGRNALAQLGIDLPEEPDETKIKQALQRLGTKLEGQKIEDLAHLPAMTDPQMSAVMKVLGMLFAPIFQGATHLMPLLTCEMVSLSLEFGNAPASIIGYVAHGMMLCAFLGDVELGYRFGRLAMSLLDKPENQPFKSCILLLFGNFIHHHKESLPETFPVFKEGMLAGIEVGDFVYYGYNVTVNFSHHFFAGMPLNDWQGEMEEYCTFLEKIKQYSGLNYVRMEQEVIQNLLKFSSTPEVLQGNAYDEGVMLEKHHQEQELTPIGFLYVYKLLLAYLFGRYDQALGIVETVQPYIIAVTGMFQTPVFHFYAGLTYLQQYARQEEGEQQGILEQVQHHQQILTRWAYFAPMNHQHKVELLEAEKCRVLGNKAGAIEGYDRAIAQAQTNGYLHEAALGNELAAEFYLDWGKEAIAQTYLTQAYYSYVHWGATAKVEQLEQCYPSLLAPILQTVQSPLSATETVFSTTPFSHLPTLGEQTSTSTSMAQTLDLTTVLKASQTLSSEIELEQLLSTLLQTVLENAGADKGVLLMPHESKWYVEGVAQLGESARVTPVPFAQSVDVPHRLIHSIKRSLQPTVIMDATADPSLATDAYILQQQPKSVLCTPILHQGKLVAILYLENRLTVGVFTGDRVELLRFLCTQAAISLENARLYQQAQQALKDLQEAQLQMVQSEKMSALGNLVAGIAHEINNPLGFILGNVKEAIANFTDISDYLRLYQEKYPPEDEAIKAKGEEVEIDYLLEDFPNLLASMVTGCDRIQEISTSLRIFSRADHQKKIPFNLHDGLNSTLLILKHRLKANASRPAIEVIQNYGQIPPIRCFPGELNQVFMNILANAIDALEENSHNKTFAQMVAHPNQIIIHTTQLNHTVKIAIADNGQGIDESVKPQIFNHLFTTKAVGKGTGLGLAIARQIVVEKHQGEITVNSQPGKGTEFIITLPFDPEPK
ncbi:trifunctional serine/threonine-protein kinase/ATP-binding protein/sensor histidine kinase [Spirulina subsalsa]|uniref:trifunctional serine/threonine-protein kinase/ATP-binding protein/sensor histidine kinase n=1 Tax=Spirulina subsalsa TaxID=54311 RepID=UPI00037E5FC0|nr:ATP-binding sensor histidine kinase [Spirulina subsalsa]